MSLISDALKAAAAEKSALQAGVHDGARQVLKGRFDRRTPIAGAAEWLYRPVRVPRHVQAATGIIILAVAASTLIVALRPANGNNVVDPAARLLTGASLVTAYRAATVSAPGMSVLQSAGVAETTESAGAMALLGPGAIALVQPSAAVERNTGTDLAGAPASTLAGSRSGPDSVVEASTPAVETPSPAPSSSAADRRQLSDQELRVNASVRPNGDLFAAAVQAQRTRDFGAAIALYQQILLRDRNDVEVLNNLGVSYQSLAQYDAASDAFRRALAIQPEYAAAWSNLGVVLGLLGQETEARTAFAEAIRQDPGNLGTKVNLALLYQRQGLTSEAKRLLQEVIAADPRVAEAHFALGGIFEGEGNSAVALRHYQLFLSTAGSRFPAYEPLVAARVARLQGRTVQ